MVIFVQDLVTGLVAGGGERAGTRGEARTFITVPLTEDGAAVGDVPRLLFVEREGTSVGVGTGEGVGVTEGAGEGVVDSLCLIAEAAAAATSPGMRILAGRRTGGESAREGEEESTGL